MRAIPTCSFQVGDRVIVTADKHASGNSSICRGDIGTVCDIHGAFVNGVTYLVGVSFDEDVGGHVCDGSCEKGHGWYVRDYELARLVDIERDYSGVEIATDEELLDFLGIT